ncbi:TPA: hypothetical protein DCP77_01250 [Candidatus Collierbacteria bacterium]|uniref:UDP-3-O-acyl-N-acetylglucosamine deacetylase n=1 Tax=Candidatus Collierbacteria bacterium GW2011_GWA2_42_17 TaxID=1618378 RepID=A0A0G1C050_9BACT|nr:MAG: UDP-3-O-[3-hydroxymyristoyl] N-acetylglucosamine deacetylase [Candidatus Collierbacteria bacterium GW2011_GWB2_42_12]KKS43043.1 MAG: UDP-3-O-[3-hydroxymyristoyl] N-acetylglucosamine deacetylase [Candidatus Collierbacteria bacterium GW2011_GWA2_42_17]KKS62433.1 MAG: UDP-3-O-[3-hydroxymyristoyl] N-acetylglucosamine deacetylase [Candidatus Collierbacteria bacterium GW2011_GWF1_42_50]KKS62925.1 MAG: UDP-3-O-[3-hydroxymyristoyl] N-acetylglucosamine deacetylase [Candidatus Collierbacteria bact
MQAFTKVTTNHQTTIKKAIKFNGYSLFSGELLSMKIEPAEINTGINFYLHGICIPALAEYIKQTDIHTTVLSKDGVDVSTVEHLLAAIWGLNIDNLKIVLSNSVIPAKDGSAEPYVKALLKAGIIKQNAFKKVIVVNDSSIITQPEFPNRFAKFAPFPKLYINCIAPFPQPIGEHTVVFEEDSKAFSQDISWARTFLRSPLDLQDLSKWQGIRSVFRSLPEDPRQSPIITFTEKEFLTPLKKNNEPARHKLLDLIGDLALIGFHLQAKIDINEPGHKFTHLIAKKIRQSLFNN